jgi:hypothetical protein
MMIESDPVATVGRLIAAMAPDQVERLFRLHGSPSALRARRLAERDGLLFDLARHYEEGSGRTLAAAVHRHLLRYATGNGRFDREPPDDPKRSLQWRIIKLSGGRVISAGQIKDILAGR